MFFWICHLFCNSAHEFEPRINLQQLRPFQRSIDVWVEIFSKARVTLSELFEVKGSASLWWLATLTTVRAYLKTLSERGSLSCGRKRGSACCSGNGKVANCYESFFGKVVPNQANIKDARWSYLARSGYRLCPTRIIYHVLVFYPI